jgi:hypothetical protein
MAEPNPKAKAWKPAEDRPMTDQREKQKRGRSTAAKMLTKDEARRIAIDVARLSELLGKAERDRIQNTPIRGNAAQRRLMPYRCECSQMTFATKSPPISRRDFL